MPSDLVLAIDLGTSAVKVAAVAADGTVVRGERLTLGPQQPAAWWAASGLDACAWPLDVLAETGLPIEVLPAVRLPWECAGQLTSEAARALGLPPGLPVAVGAHDGVAAQIGSGMIAPGDAALTLGTHAVLRVVVPQVPEAAARFRFYSLWGEADARTVAGGNAR